MKRNLSVLFLIVFLTIILLSGCAAPEERAWWSGQKALAEEKYGEAAESFEKAGAFQDAGRLLSYARAFQNYENGDFEAAGYGFQALGDFKDSLLMDSYCRARQQEAVAQAAFTSEDAEAAVLGLIEAASIYTELSLFRDSDMRAADCRDQIFGKAKEWMNLNQYDEAAYGFEALGDWQESRVLKEYCKAASLEQKGAYLEAADLFSQIPDVLDSVSRAENVRMQIYHQAEELKEKGDFEAAAAAFESLGSYRDAKEQADRAVVLLVREMLQAGRYADALGKLEHLADLSVFSPADQTQTANLVAFLNSFLNAWMNAHAGVMNGFFSRNLLQPYLIPESELDSLILSELPDDLAFQNYGYVFQGADVKNLLILDGSILYADLHGASSYSSPDGNVETVEDLLVLVETGGGYPRIIGVLSK